MQSGHAQRGMGLIKLIFVGGALAVLVIVGIKCLPIYGNEAKLARAVNGVANEGGDPATIVRALQRRWDIEDISYLQPKDVRFEKGASGNYRLTYSYEARVHLFYNADLVLTFSGGAEGKPLS